VDAADLVATRALERRPRGNATVLVAIAGAVSAGKSTFAEEIATVVMRHGATTEVVSTDGFLLPDATLLERGLMARKGFPESYDTPALRRLADGVRGGATGLTVPVYSHVTYDVVPGAAHPLPPSDVVLVEGVNALGALAGRIDLGVYLHAEERHLEQWYVDRFVALCEEARDDPESFYRRFADLDATAVRGLAQSTWDHVNLPNLREHIEPTRALADIVVVKGPGHVITDVREHA
jgi:type I pantothenate kinase